MSVREEIASPFRDLADAIARAAPQAKMNPNHDDRGRFSDGGGSGGSAGSIPEPFTQEWHDHWAKRSSALGRIAFALALLPTLPIILTAIAAHKGVSYLANAIKKTKQSSQADLQTTIDQISQLTKAARGKVFNEILSGLSKQDAEAISAAVHNPQS